MHSMAVRKHISDEKAVKRRKSIHPSRIVVVLVMVGLALFFIIPIWFMLVTSFKSNTLGVRDMGSIMALVPRFSSPDVPIPENWGMWSNYQDVFRRTNFLRMAFNSVFITSTVVGFRLVFDSMAAYSLSRLKWTGQSLILGLVISLIIMPAEVINVPLLLFVNRLGWINSYHVQIIPFISSPLAIFLFYQFFLNFPRELEEAAIVDGASYGRIYYSLLIPSAKPVLATVGILGFLEQWGSFMWPLMTTRDSAFRPVMLGLFFFFNEERTWGAIMAYASMITIPLLIVFLLFQRWFIASVASSGLKG